jgi:hypothetical protein
MERQNVALTESYQMRTITSSVGWQGFWVLENRFYDNILYTFFLRSFSRLYKKIPTRHMAYSK